MIKVDKIKIKKDERMVKKRIKINKRLNERYNVNEIEFKKH